VRFFLILAIIAFSLSPLATHAASVAGVVLEISDAQDAQITAPSEIRSGTTIVLGKNGRIKFVHYVTCDEVTAIGGAISVSALDVAATDSQITRAKITCPGRIPLSLSTSAPIPQVGCLDCYRPTGNFASSNTIFILLGNKAHAVAAVRLTPWSAGTKPNNNAVHYIDLDVANSRLILPVGGLPDGSYFCQFLNEVTGTPFFVGYVSGIMLEVSDKAADDHVMAIVVN
jgi:hypothetical protein